MSELTAVSYSYHKISFSSYVSHITSLITINNHYPTNIRTLRTSVLEVPEALVRQL